MASHQFVMSQFLQSWLPELFPAAGGTCRMEVRREYKRTELWQQNSVRYDRPADMVSAGNYSSYYIIYYINYIVESYYISCYMNYISHYINDIMNIYSGIYYVGIPSYNNSRCVYIFPVPRIVATALNIWDNNDIFLF